MSKQVLVIDPQLAAEIGLEAAVFINQLHYWSTKRNVGKHYNGLKYVRNTLDEWQENFPFWSVNQLRRIIKSLVDSGYIAQENLNETTYDRTLWYAVQYENLPFECYDTSHLCKSTNGDTKTTNGSVENHKSICANPQMEVLESTNPSVGNHTPIPVDYTETTSETTEDSPPPPDPWDKPEDQEILFKLHQDSISFVESWCKLTRQKTPYRYGDDVTDRQANADYYLPAAELIHEFGYESAWEKVKAKRVEIMQANLTPKRLEAVSSQVFQDVEREGMKQLFQPKQKQPAVDLTGWTFDLGGD